MSTPITLQEGWHVLHQFYTIDSDAWNRIPADARPRHIDVFKNWIGHLQSSPLTQILLYSTIGRADFGFMLITPDLHLIDESEKQIRASLGPGVIRTHDSFLSLTEESEYKTSEEEFAAQLENQEGLKPGSPEFDSRLQEWKDRMAKYRHDRVYPVIADWKTICFYPMAKRRQPGQNWYGLDYETRRTLMGGHARTGRAYAGKVRQLITGATGLSDWEWGVTLFSNDLYQIKSIVYEMRYDEVSHTYGEFGPFTIGILMQPDELLARVLPPPFDFS